MERLTECVGYHNNKPIYKTKIDMRKIGAVDIFKNRLGNYEDAEEQGLLLRLPCKVGDTVYCIRTICDGKDTKEITDFKVLRFDIGKHILMVNEYTHTLNIADIGKTVFLTREEAEKALADMGV